MPRGDDDVNAARFKSVQSGGGQRRYAANLDAFPCGVLFFG